MVEIIMTMLSSSYAYGKGEEEALQFSLQVMRVSVYHDGGCCMRTPPTRDEVDNDVDLPQYRK